MWNPSAKITTTAASPGSPIPREIESSCGSRPKIEVFVARRRVSRSLRHSFKEFSEYRRVSLVVC